MKGSVSVSATLDCSPTLTQAEAAPEDASSDELTLADLTDEQRLKVQDDIDHYAEQYADAEIGVKITRNAEGGLLFSYSVMLGALSPEEQQARVDDMHRRKEEAQKCAEERKLRAAAEAAKRVTDGLATSAAVTAAVAAMRTKLSEGDGKAACQELADLLLKGARGKGDGSFVDEDFHAGPFALYINHKAKANGGEFKVAEEWARPRAGSVLFAGGKADSTHVKQGGLGDCWAISAIATLASHGCIPELFLTPFNKEGLCVIRLFRAGRWVPVIIDDRLPLRAGSTELAFARSSDPNELWVSLLEKAYAKFYGSYEGLEGGVVSDALIDFTGGDGETFNLVPEVCASGAAADHSAHAEDVWSRLHVAHSHASGDAEELDGTTTLIGCGSHAGSDTDVSSTGIVLGHAYSVLRVVELPEHGRLLQVRNPWGGGKEWCGDWSDTSHRWKDAALCKLLDYMPRVDDEKSGKGGDGVFWINLDDFQKQFENLYTCRIFPPSCKHEVKGVWDEGSSGGAQVFTETYIKARSSRIRCVAILSPLTPSFRLHRTQCLCCAAPTEARSRRSCTSRCCRRPTRATSARTTGSRSWRASASACLRTRERTGRSTGRTASSGRASRTRRLAAQSRTATVGSCLPPCPSLPPRRAGSSCLPVLRRRGGPGSTSMSTQRRG